MKKTVIVCPNCGAEYLPQEIYIPNAFFGKAIHIERDKQNQITDIVGSNLDTEETYTCNFCNVPFFVTAKISFSTKVDSKRNFEEDYATKITKEKFLFDEE